MSWTTLDIPSQLGKTAIITGTGGLGLETAIALAGAGADVIVAGRNAQKGEAAVDRIKAAHAQAKVRFEEVDLANLASVEAFAARMHKDLPALDILVNNAGLMMLPKRQETADGFEMQLGTNYLGHFALTARLMPLLRRAKAPRVVNVSSGMAALGKFDFSDLQLKRKYGPQRAYGNSKLAMLLFAQELDRRSKENGWNIHATAAHPGYARTELIANGPGSESLMARVSSALISSWGSQSAADGALPQLMAATAPDVHSGAFYGPSKRFQLVGPPTQVKVPSSARNQSQVAAQLWEASEALCRVNFNET